MQGEASYKGRRMGYKELAVLYNVKRGADNMVY